MTLHPLNNRVVVACASRPQTEAVVRWYAYLITGLHKTAVHILPSGAWADIEPLARDRRIGMLVSDWASEDAAFAERLRLVDQMRVPAVFVREDQTSRIRKVWVATAGGPNTLPLMWVAGTVASAVGAPVRILRFVSEDEARPFSNDDAPYVSIESLTSSAVGMPFDTSVENASDLAAAVEGRVSPEDLLILGAPSTFRLAQGFAGSLPDLVARRVRNPLFLMMSGGAAPVTLRRLFWGRLVQTGLRVDSREAVLRHLVHTLARHHQVPVSVRDEIVDRALRQRVITPLVSECETVLHHVTLPDFVGISGSMGICSDGVDVGIGDGDSVRFFFLLLTCEGYCEEYLQVLARIAKRMSRPDVREALLACEGPSEVLDIFEPGQQAALRVTS